MQIPLFLLSILMMTHAFRYPLFRSYRFSGFHTHSDSLALFGSKRKGDDASGSGHKLKSMSPTYFPKTPNQKEYLRYLVDPEVSIVLGVGPAGTGKTLFACHTAIQLLKRGTIQKIVLTRPVVSVEEDLGFLPGNLVMKMDPWTRPIFDILLEFYTQKNIDDMVQGGVIEISPLAYMRGRTFKRAFIIADEMQNSSPNQMMMLTTRIGEGSKMVITGDLNQSDRYTQNGLRDILYKLDSFRRRQLATSGMNTTLSEFPPGIRAVEMSMDDVERSAIVREVLALYSPKEPSLAQLVKASLSEPPLSPNSTQSLPSADSFEMLEADADANADAALIPKRHMTGRGAKPKPKSK